MYIFKMLDLVNSMLAADVARIGNVKKQQKLSTKISFNGFSTLYLLFRISQKTVHICRVKFLLYWCDIAIHDYQITCNRVHPRQACDLWCLFFNFMPVSLHFPVELRNRFNM